MNGINGQRQNVLIDWAIAKERAVNAALPHARLSRNVPIRIDCRMLNLFENFRQWLKASILKFGDPLRYIRPNPWLTQQLVLSK